MRVQWFAGGVKTPPVFSPVFSAALTGDNGGSAATVCELFAGPFSKSGSQVRLTIMASAASAFVITDLWMGSQGAGNPYNFDGTQVRLKVAGATSFTVPIGGTVVTDAINYNFIGANNFVTACFATSGNSKENLSASGVTRYFTAANEASLTSKTAGYTANIGTLDLITKIEVFG